MDSSTLYAARSSLVRALMQVQSLKMGTIDLRAFGNLGQLHTLETLHIEIPPSISFNGVVEHMLFTNLREAELDVQRDDIVRLTGFVRMFEQSPLESFSASLNSYPSQKDIGDLYHALALHCVHDCLQGLKLELFKLKIAVTYPPSSTHPADALRHLLPFANLVIVSIDVPTGFDLDNHRYDAGLALPRKTRTEDRCSAQSPAGIAAGPPNPVRDCPDLQKPEIALDATSIPTPRGPPRSHGTSRRRASSPSEAVWNSRIHDAFAVARFFSSIFMNVKEVRPADGNFLDIDTDLALGFSQAWREVEVFLPELVELREEE